MTGRMAREGPDATRADVRRGSDPLRTADDEELLAEERDFLLASLRDLEAEHDAGDIDEHDYRTLKADYTARAAALIRALEDPGTVSAEGSQQGSPDSGRGVWRRRLVAVGTVAVIAAVAGVLVAQSSGRRGSSGPTGLDVSAASSRLGECQTMETEGDPDAALDCYGEILVSLPANVGALTFRGWLQIRSFDTESGLDDLDQAIELAPDATAPYIFRASGRSRIGDAPGAVADLAAFYANEPADEERELADQFTPTIVDAALDACISGDVTGDLRPVVVVECYRNILDVDDGNPTASIYLGWMLGRSGLTSEALTLLDAGLAADPDAAAGYVFRAAVRAHTGDTEGALADLAAFDDRNAASELPADQVAAAVEVRAAIDAGRDPLARP